MDIFTYAPRGFARSDRFPAAEQTVQISDETRPRAGLESHSDRGPDRNGKPEVCRSCAALSLQGIYLYDTATAMVSLINFLGAATALQKG